MVYSGAFSKSDGEDDGIQPCVFKTTAAMPTAIVYSRAYSDKQWEHAAMAVMAYRRASVRNSGDDRDGI